MNNKIISKVSKFLLTLIAITGVQFVAADPELIPPSNSFGPGDEYQFVDFSTLLEGQSALISKLQKNGVEFSFSQTGEARWSLDFLAGGVHDSFVFTNGINKVQYSRLVDVILVNGKLGVLLNHPMGYWYYLAEKVNGEWVLKMVVGIHQSEFVTGDESDPTVISAQIENENRVVIKRTNSVDAVYEFSLTDGEIGGAGHGNNVAAIVSLKRD